MSIAGEPGNPAHPERDADWDENARGESLAERLTATGAISSRSSGWSRRACSSSPASC